jgi:cell division protein ZapA (FtsZ GTPase activity inhibitor)
MLRESKFPLDRILQATDVDIKQAEASVESDRRFILNSITGQSKDDAVMDDHANYDELNNILRGIFVLPALERIIKETNINSITRCLEIVKASNARIIDLDLRHCSRFDDNMLIKLADSLPPTLTEFLLTSSVSRAFYCTEGIDVSIRKILGCPHLMRLDLSSHNIGVDVVKMIADAIKDNHSLKILNLTGSNICDDGAKMIADAIKVNQSLEKLNLSSNKIGDDGVKVIVDALQVNHSLKRLSFHCNDISADGVKYLYKIKQELKDINRDIDFD